MIDNLILLAGVVVVALVAAFGFVAFDAWARRCIDCRRRFAVYPFRRCRRHRVRV